MRRISVHLGAAVLLACSVACGAGRIALADGRLVEGTSPFLVRGVGYSNAAIGEAGGSKMAASSCRWARDLSLLASTGANTVRTYALLPDSAAPFLDLLDSTGLYWLAGFPLEPYYDPARTILARKREILEAFEQYAQRFRAQPRLIGYVFGHEVARDYHRKFAGSPDDFYALLADAAETLRRLEPDQTPLLTTAVHDLAELSRAPAGLSFWCWNASPGRTFGGLLAEARRRASKPVLISDFGVDAFDERTRLENESAQAEAVGTLVTEIEGAGWLLGGIYSTLLDEWWRGGGDPAWHGVGGAPHAGFPDGFRNDGWLGLLRVAPSGQPGLDHLYPRAAYAALAARWGGRGILAPVETPRLLRLQNAASLTDLISPGALVRASGERLAGVVASEPAWPLYLGQTCLCFGEAAARLGMMAPGEISAQVPGVLAAGPARAVVYRSGLLSSPLAVTLLPYAPGIFPTGVVWAGSNCPAGPLNAVRPGDVLEVYATGLGAGEVRAELAGFPAPVLFSGPLPAAVGLHQVNLQVPADLGPLRGGGLRLLVEGIPSNLYPLSVSGPGETPGLALRADPPELVLQAGGEPGAVTVHVEGVNGFCGAVLFQVERASAGVSFHIPAAFPGQAVPLRVWAAPGALAPPGSALVLTGYSGGVSAPLALKLEVLPNQGPIPVKVTSAGFSSGSLVRFEWGWRTLFAASGGGPGRGVSLISVDPVTGVFSPARTFDTWGDEQAADALLRRLAGLPMGTIVMMAVADDASYRLTQQARDAIAGWFGSQYIRSLGYQHSWAIIGRKGAPAPLAEAGSPDRPVTLHTVLPL